MGDELPRDGNYALALFSRANDHANRQIARLSNRLQAPANGIPEPAARWWRAFHYNSDIGIREYFASDRWIVGSTTMFLPSYDQQKSSTWRVVTEVISASNMGFELLSTLGDRNPFDNIVLCSGDWGISALSSKSVHRQAPVSVHVQFADCRPPITPIIDTSIGYVPRSRCLKAAMGRTLRCSAACRARLVAKSQG